MADERRDERAEAGDVERVRALEGDRGMTVESEIAAGDAEAEGPAAEQ